MMQWMRFSNVVVGGLFCFSLTAVANSVVRDFDNDGVSDYEDYCPNTPAGSVVWKPEQLGQDGVQPRWIGCAGGADVAAPGYNPPSRPSNSFLRMEEMFDAAGDFDLHANNGWYSGRCWNDRSEKPIAAILVLISGGLAGPAFPDDFEMLPLRAEDKEANYFDDLSFSQRSSTEDFIARVRRAENQFTRLDIGYGARIGASGALSQVRRDNQTGYFFSRRGYSEGLYMNCYYFKKIN